MRCATIQSIKLLSIILPVPFCRTGLLMMLFFTAFITNGQTVPDTIHQVTATPATVLPLQLLSFSGKNINGHNDLTWQTASEVNISRYVIERSTDSRHFDSIGLVNSISRNTRNTYNFIDAQPLKSSYYRLKISDADGAVTYSAIVFIENGTNGNLQILYQQETGLLRVSGLSDNSSYSIAIYNTMGQVVSKTATIANGQEMSISNLTKGLYQVALQEKGKIVALKKVIW